MDWLTEYCGVPYAWCLDFENGGREGSRAPFWRVDTLPTYDDLVEEGCCCVGLVNLVRIKDKKPTWAGTGHIWNELEDYLEPMDKEPEEGAMLIRAPRDMADQGHVGIVLSDGRYIHSHVDEFEGGPQPGLFGPGVTLDKSWRESHRWHRNGYYDGWVKAEVWKNK
jgi:hypothetical protein